MPMALLAGVSPARPRAPPIFAAKFPGVGPKLLLIGKGDGAFANGRLPKPQPKGVNSRGAFDGTQRDGKIDVNGAGTGPLTPQSEKRCGREEGKGGCEKLGQPGGGGPPTMISGLPPPPPTITFCPRGGANGTSLIIAKHSHSRFLGPAQEYSFTRESAGRDFPRGRSKLRPHPKSRGDSAGKKKKLESWHNCR